MQEYKVTIDSEGTIRWYKPNSNISHRTDGPAVEYTDGSKEWWIDGKYHRTDGPAMEWADGSKFWYIDGKYHRTDGPAVEYANGDKEWYIDGKYLTEKEFVEFNSRNCNCDGKIVVIDGQKYRLESV